MADGFIEKLVCAYCEEAPPLYKINGEWFACETCKQNVERGIQEAGYQIYCAESSLRAELEDGEEPDPLVLEEIDQAVHINTVVPPKLQAQALKEMRAWIQAEARAREEREGDS